MLFIVTHISPYFKLINYKCGYHHAAPQGRWHKVIQVYPGKADTQEKEGERIMASVTKIPASVSRFTSTPITEQKKRKVAGYARVSTDHDDQFTSYEAQIDYYLNL